MADALLRFRVTPRSAKTGITRVEDGVVHVRVSAPPVDGAANAELIKLIAPIVGAPKSRIAIRSGASGREKLVRIEGVDTAEALRRIEAHGAKR
jgi:hypothetical protein